MNNNVHFDKESYRHEIYTGSSNRRRVSRGFAPFIIDAVDRCLNNNRTLKEIIPAILELGVGGGGSHLNWEKFSNARIYGIEYFHPDKVKELSTLLGEYLRKVGADRPLFKQTNQAAPWPAEI